ARGRAPLRHPAAGRGHVPVPLRRSGRHGGHLTRVRAPHGHPGGPARAPGRLRPRGPSGALPPVHPALGGGTARRPPLPAAQRTAPLGAPGRTARAVGVRGDRLGLGLRGGAGRVQPDRGRAAPAGSSRTGAGRRRPGSAGQGPGGAGRVQASGRATILPFSTATARRSRGATAGSRVALPVATSNSLPWQGQISRSPSSLLAGHRACVQIVLYAVRVPSSARLTTTLWSR